jgi:hypothetical protein
VKAVALRRLNGGLLRVGQGLLRILPLHRPIFGTAFDATLIVFTVVNVVAVVFGCKQR